MHKNSKCAFFRNFPRRGYCIAAKIALPLQADKKDVLFFHLNRCYSWIIAGGHVGKRDRFFLSKSGLKTNKMRAKYRKTHFFCIFSLKIW